jgi:hypothetical protein
MIIINIVDCNPSLFWYGYDVQSYYGYGCFSFSDRGIVASDLRQSGAAAVAQLLAAVLSPAGGLRGSLAHPRGLRASLKHRWETTVHQWGTGGKWWGMLWDVEDSNYLLKSEFWRWLKVKISEDVDVSLRKPHQPGEHQVSIRWPSTFQVKTADGWRCDKGYSGTVHVQCVLGDDTCQQLQPILTGFGLSLLHFRETLKSPWVFGMEIGPFRREC